jgi:hypothetical protein
MTRRWHPALVVAACAILLAPLATATAQTGEDSPSVSTEGDVGPSNEEDQNGGFWDWVKTALKPDESAADDPNARRDPGGGGGGGGGGDGGGSGGHN